MHKKLSLIAEAFCVITIFLITYAIVQRQMGYGYTDFNAHVETAMVLNESGFLELIRICAYPLWHVLAATANKVLMMPFDAAAALITGFFNVLTYCVALRVFREELDTSAEVFIPFGVLMLCIIQTFCIPWYNKEIYIGQIAPNIWHNPTNMCAKPFMLLVFLQVRSILTDYENGRNINRKIWMQLAGIMFFCNLAKPSCAQIFIPGGGMVCILLLHKNIKKNLMFVIKLMMTALPCILLMIVQYVVSFYLSPLSNGVVEVAWLDVWKAWCPSVIMSLILNLAFPVYCLVLAVRQHEIHDIEYKIVACFWICGLLEYGLFAETGVRRYDGNFMWGLSLIHI